MPHISEQSPGVLVERLAKGSGDVSGRRDKYACYPACPAHALSECIADDLAVVCRSRAAPASPMRVLAGMWIGYTLSTGRTSAWRVRKSGALDMVHRATLIISIDISHIVSAHI